MKSSKTRLVLISGFVILAQMALVPLISFNGITPDLIFLLVAFYAFAIDHRSVLWVAFSLGLCRDFLANTFFGLETASLVCGALLLQYAVAQFDRRDHFIKIASVFIFSLTTLALSASILLVIRGHAAAGPEMFRILMISGYTAILSMGIFPIFEYLSGLERLVQQHELF